MKKKLPRFRSDKEAEDFVEKADLTEYDLSAMRPIRFEFQPKSERVNMRVPRQLLDAVRASAAKAGVPYQRFIRQALEEKRGLFEKPSPANNVKRLRRYGRASFAGTAAEYVHSLWHEVTIRTGPDYLPARPLRRRLDLMARWFPPERGYRLFPAAPRLGGPSPSALAW